MHVYCGNNPVICVDYEGNMWQLVPALDPRNMVRQAPDFGGISGGGSRILAKTTYYDSSAYGTYSIRSSVSNSDASLGGYHYGGGATTNPGYYNVPGAISVTDDMATNQASSEPYGNSKASTKPQHGYIIYE